MVHLIEGGSTLPGGDLEHVIYLGGLQPEEAPRSEHLASRAEVGAIFRERVPTTESRAGPIVGSGSGSFEILRYLTERLPVMVAPRGRPGALYRSLSYPFHRLVFSRLARAVAADAERLDA